MLFSAFRYNVGFWPKQLVEKVGNLVLYRSKFQPARGAQGQRNNTADDLSLTDHKFGGHFPGLDNPPALLEDLREIGNYWKSDLSIEQSRAHGKSTIPGIGLRHLVKLESCGRC